MVVRCNRTDSYFGDAAELCRVNIGRLSTRDVQSQRFQEVVKSHIPEVLVQDHRLEPLRGCHRLVSAEDAFSCCKKPT